MRKKMIFISVSGLAIVLSAFLLQLQLLKPALETITFFPIDESVQYRMANTTLTLLNKKQNNKHQVDWKLSSTLDRKAYLRQDLGLLFVNGVLEAKTAKWEENTANLTQEQILSAGESARYDAITFHYSELHGPNDIITSAQRMSEDMLYVIDSRFSPLRSFRAPKNNQEREWKQVLDKSTDNRINKTLAKAAKTFQIDTNSYIMIPLNELRKYEDQPFPGFNQGETAVILGRLWEGLYKNYYLGIKKSDGAAVDPLDSTMPLILVSKNKSHLLVVTQTKDGESIVLKQLIPGNS